MALCVRSGCGARRGHGRDTKSGEANSGRFLRPPIVYLIRVSGKGRGCPCSASSLRPTSRWHTGQALGRLHHDRDHGGEDEACGRGGDPAADQEGEVRAAPRPHSDTPTPPDTPTLRHSDTPTLLDASQGGHLSRIPDTGRHCPDTAPTLPRHRSTPRHQCQPTLPQHCPDTAPTLPRHCSTLRHSDTAGLKRV